MRTLFFPRYQRTFLRLGDVGSHPQFRHLGLPPKGYDFIERPMTWREWLAALPKGLNDSFRAWVQIHSEGRQAGLSLLRIFRFLWTRGFDRIVPGPKQAVASFLPTFPLTHQNEHWFLEIEDVTTLFRPYVLNGKTSEGSYRDLPVFPLIENMLSSDKCLGILTHVQSTKDSIAKIFGSERINSKSECIQVPYLPRREVSEETLNEMRNQDPIQFFFNNSWHQDLSNFYLRGGISILEAFDQALKDGLPVRLNLRSRIPKDIRIRFAKLLESNVVNVLDSFLPEDQFLSTLRSSHYFLLPSARIHVVSLLESQYYGAVPIVSDGWGIREYVSDKVDGFVISGVYGRVSWADETSGELREDYQPMYAYPGILTEGIYQTLRRVVETRDHERMSLTAHRKVRDELNVSKFNSAFGKFLDARFASEPVSRH